MTDPDVQVLWRDIMNQATLSLWTQKNVALSWPIPSPAGAEQLLLFTYSSVKINQSVERIGRPDARVIWHSEYALAMQTGKGFPGLNVKFPVEYVSPWQDALLVPFLLDELTSLFNAALAFYPHHNPPPVFFERLCMLWDQAVPPCLLPYHEALNPDFFAWLRQ